MNSLERLFRELNIFIDTSLDFLENPVIRFVIITILVVYITALVPMLNKELNDLFEHPIVKVLLLILIIYLGSKDPLIALLFAIAFILSLLHTKYYGNFDNIKVPEYIPEVKENKDTSEQIRDEKGYNQDDKQCSNQCDTNGNMNNGNEQCTPITAFSNELNSQGMNCPMGNGMDLFGSPF